MRPWWLQRLRAGYRPDTNNVKQCHGLLSSRDELVFQAPLFQSQAPNLRVEPQYNPCKNIAPSNDTLRRCRDTTDNLILRASRNSSFGCLYRGMVGRWERGNISMLAGTAVFQAWGLCLKISGGVSFHPRNQRYC